MEYSVVFVVRIIITLLVSPIGVLISSTAGREQPGPEQQIPRTVQLADATERHTNAIQYMIIIIA